MKFTLKVSFEYSYTVFRFVYNSQRMIFFIVFIQYIIEMYWILKDLIKMDQGTMSKKNEHKS